MTMHSTLRTIMKSHQKTSLVNRPVCSKASLGAMQRITLSPYQFPKRLGVQLVAQAVSSPRLGQWVVFFYNPGGIDEKDNLV